MGKMAQLFVNIWYVFKPPRFWETRSCVSCSPQAIKVGQRAAVHNSLSLVTNVQFGLSLLDEPF